MFGDADHELVDDRDEGELLPLSESLERLETRCPCACVGAGSVFPPSPPVLPAIRARQRSCGTRGKMRVIFYLFIYLPICHQHSSVDVAIAVIVAVVVVGNDKR